MKQPSYEKQLNRLTWILLLECEICNIEDFSNQIREISKDSDGTLEGIDKVIIFCNIL